jgi:hypothetical protein
MACISTGTKALKARSRTRHGVGSGAGRPTHPEPPPLRHHGDWPGTVREAMNTAAEAAGVGSGAGTHPGASTAETSWGIVEAV